MIHKPKDQFFVIVSSKFTFEGLYSQLLLGIDRFICLSSLCSFFLAFFLEVLEVWGKTTLYCN